MGITTGVIFDSVIFSEPNQITTIDEYQNGMEVNLENIGITFEVQEFEMIETDELLDIPIVYMGNNENIQKAYLL